jgi:rRNA maturation RNase YbeY
MGISFVKSSVITPLANKSLLKKWLTAVIKKEGFKTGKIHYSFVGDLELLEINKQFLNHDTYTDIITFDYNENNTINGEIFISVDRIIENAIKNNVSYDNELHRVMVHGILHLCGYSDKGKKHKLEMTAKEDEMLLLKKD